MANEVLLHLSRIRPLIVLLAPGNTNSEGQVAILLVKKDLDDGARAQHPPVDDRLGGILGSRVQEVAVDKGAIGGLVLNHDIAVLVDIYAEVDVADALQGVVVEDNVAPRCVATKAIARGGVLDLGGQSQDQRIAAVGGEIGFEAARMVLELVVGLNSVDLILTNNVGRVLLGKSLYLLSGGVGMRVEDADDVGDVFVGEARVLLPYAARVEDILGR